VSPSITIYKENLRGAARGYNSQTRRVTRARSALFARRARFCCVWTIRALRRPRDVFSHRCFFAPVASLGFRIASLRYLTRLRGAEESPRLRRSMRVSHLSQRRTRGELSMQPRIEYEAHIGDNDTRSARRIPKGPAVKISLPRKTPPTAANLGAG